MLSDKLIEKLCCPSCSTQLTRLKDTMRCSNCSTTLPVIDNVPRFFGTTQKEIIDIDRRNVSNPANWTGWRRKNYDFFKRTLEEVSDSSEILDIGAGPSQFAVLLDRFRTHRTDFEPYQGIDFLTDLNKPLPLSDGSYDIIVMSNVLEHIPDPLSLLQECHRVLKKDGKIVITVPFLIKVHQAPYDFLRYTEFMLDRLFQQSGFNDIRIEKIGNILDVYAQVYASIHKACRNSFATNIFKRKLMGLFSALHTCHIKLLLKVTGCSSINKDDDIGYPHGYGCIAIKKS